MPPEPPAQLPTIVVIEDDPDVLETMKDLLEWMGHSVTTAPDGEIGLALILARPPDIALVDIDLPGMDGYEVAERVRAALGPDRVRLVALTGFGTETERRRDPGFEAHLIKPFDLDALTQILAERGAR